MIKHGIKLLLLGFLVLRGSVLGINKTDESERKQELIKQNPLLAGFFLFKEICSPSNCSYFTTCAFSPDGKLIVAGTHNGSILIYDLINNGLKYFFPCDFLKSSHSRPVAVSSIYFSRDSSVVFSVDARGIIEGREMLSGRSVEVESNPCPIMLQGSDGIRACSSSQKYGVKEGASGSIIIMDLEKNEIDCQLAGFPRCRLGSVLFYGDDHIIAAPRAMKDYVGLDAASSYIVILNRSTGSLVDRLSCGSEKELELFLSPDHEYLATIIVTNRYRSVLYDKHHPGSSVLFNAQLDSCIRIWRSFESLSLEQLILLDKESKGEPLSEDEVSIFNSISEDARNVVARRVRKLQYDSAPLCLLL